MKSLRNLLTYMALLAFGSTAHAVIITYDLSDKQFGAKDPPDYGLRIDDLFDVAGSNWTFSFKTTNVQMIINTDGAGRVQIVGQVRGGLDPGDTSND